MNYLGVCLFFLQLVHISLALKDYPWMYYLPYGRTVRLKPLYRNKSERVVVKSCKWTTPNSQILVPDAGIIDPNRYRIDKTKCELVIYNIQKDTNGIYHAIVNDIYISKAMLNVHGAPKRSLYEEYYPNVIAGLTTAAAILVFFGITCSVYRFRYIEPIEKPININNIHQNRTFQNDDDNEDTDSNKSISDSQSYRF